MEVGWESRARQVLVAVCAQDAAVVAPWLAAGKGRGRWLEGGRTERISGV